MTSTDSGDADLAPARYLNTFKPDLINARIRLLHSLDEVAVYLEYEVTNEGRPGVIEMLRQHAQRVADDQSDVETLFSEYEEQLAAMNTDPRQPKEEMSRYLLYSGDDVQEVDADASPDNADITFVEIVGGKIKLDSPYETKDDIKAMDTDKRDWTGNYWAVSTSFAQQSIDHLVDCGYTIAVHRDVRAEIPEPLTYDTQGSTPAE